MPLKPSFDGEFVARALQSGAQQLLRDRDELRQRELSGQAQAERDTPDVFCVVERPAPPLQGDPLHEPRVEWDPQGTMPHGVPHFTVRASQSEALRNKQPLRDLLARRLRRTYRGLLIAQQAMPEADARARVMRAVVHVVESRRVLAPEEA